MIQRLYILLLHCADQRLKNNFGGAHEATENHARMGPNSFAVEWVSTGNNQQMDEAAWDHICQSMKTVANT